MRLSSSFAPRSPSIRSEQPLSDEQLRRVAPSIFAEEKHDSRSGRYTYIPTSTVLASLRKEGFEPFMAAQTAVRDENKRNFTKHMLRLRHASQIAGSEANEIILLNSHDGTSSYQMMSGMFRFVCTNGLVCGDVVDDIRVRHQGDIVDNVVDAAYEVLDGFTRVVEQRDTLRGVTLNDEESRVFAQAALALKYEPSETAPPPITEQRLLEPRRAADQSNDLWTVFNRVQENMMKGGLISRLKNGRYSSTRAVQGIDQGIKLNRALWVLAQGMAKHKG